MKCYFVAFILQIVVHCVLSVDIESICGPGTDETLIQSIHEAKGQAGDWLIGRRERHFGWPQGNSAAAVTALQLANESLSRGSEDPSLEMELTIKQLHMEILSSLSQSERALHSGKHHKSRADRLPYFIMALNATCQNASDFHGIDLVSRLREDMKRFHKDAAPNYYQHALAVLAMCSTGHPVKRRFVEDLIAGQGSDGCFQRPCSSGVCGDSTVSIDTTSIVLSALSCVSRTYLHRGVEEIETSIEGAVDCLLDNSYQNGSSGNVINDAMAAQALLAAEVNHTRWDCPRTMSSVLDAMHEDGHCGGLATTILVLPLLAGRHHRHLQELDADCPEGYPGSSHPDHPDYPISEEITIALQVMTDDRNWGYEVKGRRGESLLELMHREQEHTDSTFRFETKTTDWGEYITSINGVENDDVTGQHWLVQRMEGQEPQCIDKGAADIYPEHYEHYLWTHRMCGVASISTEEDVNANSEDPTTDGNEFIGLTL